MNNILPILVVYGIFDETELFYIPEPSADDMEMCQSLHKVDISDNEPAQDIARFEAVTGMADECDGVYEEVFGSWRQYRLEVDSAPSELKIPQGVDKVRVYWVFQS